MDRIFQRCSVHRSLSGVDLLLGAANVGGYRSCQHSWHIRTFLLAIYMAHLSVSLHFFSFDWYIPQSSCISENSLRVRWYIQHSQKMHSLSTFAPIFSQARGLHHQFSSSCVRLSRTPITMPHPTPYDGFRVSYGSRLPTSTLFNIPHKVSRVHSVGLRHNAVGGV